MRRMEITAVSRAQRRRERIIEKTMRRRVPWSVIELRLPILSRPEQKMVWTAWICLQ